MGKAEIRDAFEAYASGKLSEYELRSALRAALQGEPESVSLYAAMVAALRLRKLISAELEAAVLSDIKAVMGHGGETPPSVASAGSSETLPRAESHPSIPIVSTGPGSSRSTGPGSAWDTQERLSEPEAQVMIGQVLRERFELVEVLGRGGMGVVYKALDQREVENRGRDPYVAIKVLNEEFKRHPESARALQRESKKSMRLAHPNIVLVRDFDRDRGNVFMVMELLTGQPLDRLLRNQYPDGMPVDKVTDILRGLGAGLSYAHQQGIVHADFKPSNAFLTNQNVVKVLDFGVARAARALDRAESTLFDAGKLNAVTPAYATVEMLIGEAPDPRDDIYALACVTYLLLTGRHPYNGLDAVKAREAVLLPAPIEGIADHQWRAIYWALTFERESRTATVNEFVSQFCTDQSAGTSRRAGVGRRESRMFVGRTGTSQPADAARRALRPFATPIGAIRPAEPAPREPRLRAVRNAASKLREIAARAARLPTAIARASQRAGAALRRRWVAAHTQATKLADAAVRKPWLMAAPAGVLLAAAVVLFVPRDWYAHMRSEMSVLLRPRPSSQASMPPADSPPGITPPEPRGASINPAPDESSTAASNPPADSSASITQLEQRLAPIDPTAKDFLDRMLAHSADLKGLIALAPADETVRRLQADLQSAIASRVRLMLEDDDVAGARHLIAKVGDLLPAGATKSYSADGLARRQELIHVLAAPEATELWAHQVDVAVGRLSGLIPADDPLLKEARDTSNRTLQATADKARSNPVDGLSKLKQQLADQAVAGDVEGASATANALRRAPGGASYVANEVQQQLIESYVQLAKKQLLDANPELALQTIASGRKKFASSPDLKNLEITYDRVEEEIARINMAPSLSVRDHIGWLEEIRQLSGADYPDIEQMLARALANDIADQRAKGDRPSVVASLLESGRKVFPEYAIVLEQGKAGVLDPAQIATAEERAEPDNTSADKDKTQVAKEAAVSQASAK